MCTYLPTSLYLQLTQLPRQMTVAASTGALARKVLAKTTTTRTTQPLLTATGLVLTSHARQNRRRRSSSTISGGGGLLLGHNKRVFHPGTPRHLLTQQARALAMSSFLKNLLGASSSDNNNNGKMTSSSSSSSFPVQKTDEEWRAVLSPGEFSFPSIFPPLAPIIFLFSFLFYFYFYFYS